MVSGLPSWIKKFCRKELVNTLELEFIFIKNFKALPCLKEQRYFLKRAEQPQQSLPCLHSDLRTPDFQFQSEKTANAQSSNNYLLIDMYYRHE